MRTALLLPLLALSAVAGSIRRSVGPAAGRSPTSCPTSSTVSSGAGA